MGLIRKAVLIGAGYVLGARAGTDRYDDIVRAARALAARPEVQSGLSAVREKAGLPRSPVPAPRGVVGAPTAAPVGLASSLDPVVPVAGGALGGDPTLGSPVDPRSTRRP